MTGLLLAAGIFIAMGWFAIGWVARGRENRVYGESRLRALAAQAAAEEIERELPAPTPVWAQRVHPGYWAPPPVPAYHPGWPPVVEGQAVRELPMGWS